MNSSSSSPRRPGAVILRAARLIYDDHAVSLVFLSALGDFESDLREAGPSRVSRVATRCRWYRVLLTLLVATPFMVPKSMRADHAEVTRVVAGAWLLLGIYAFPFSGPWSCFREFMIAAGVGGTVFACVMRGWHDEYCVGDILRLQVSWEFPEHAVPTLSATRLVPSGTAARIG